jgi:hypothetical protein
MTNIANPPTQVAANCQTAFSGVEEPNLSELYRDPTLLAVLRRDGIDVAKLQAVVAAAQRRLYDAA